jgi:hypothetical protein
MDKTSELKTVLQDQKKKQEEQQIKFYNDNRTITAIELETRLQKFKDELYAELKTVLR